MLRDCCTVLFLRAHSLLIACRRKEVTRSLVPCYNLLLTSLFLLTHSYTLTTKHILASDSINLQPPIYNMHKPPTPHHTHTPHQHPHRPTNQPRISQIQDDRRNAPKAQPSHPKHNRIRKNINSACRPRRPRPPLPAIVLSAQHEIDVQHGDRGGGHEHKPVR